MRPMLAPMERGLSAPEREDLLGRVFHGSFQGLLIARLEDGTIIEANDAFLFLLGRDRDEVLSTTTSELGIFGELGDARTRTLLRERGAIDGFDARVRASTGEQRVLRLWAEAIGDGPTALAVVRASDVDGRVAAGARYTELREAEVAYRALVEQIPAITYTQIADDQSPTGFRDVYLSPQLTTLLGYTPYEWQMDPELWIRATHPDDRDRVVTQDRHAARRGTRFCEEYRMIARDGREVWFRDEAVLVEDPASGVSFWQGVMLDITEAKTAAAHHAEIEAKYRALVEQIPAVVYLGEFGAEGEWLYISPQVERVLGYTPGEWLAHPHPMGSFVHPDDLDAVWAEEERSQRDGDTFRAEYRMRAKDGRWVWILDEAMAVRDDEGRPFVLQGTMFDITERKRSEDELASALERLQALDRLKNTLLHTLSHDLKAPLTAILGAASTLERLGDELSADERRALLRTLEARSKGMNALLADLLDLDRLEQGIIEPRRFPVDLGELVRRMVEDARDALGRRTIEVDAERLTIAVDGSKVERMVENLLMNAARHTPPGARVWVRVWPQDEGATIAVEDDGAGVPDDCKTEIFEAFHRGRAARDLPGSGIGLSLVARFAELHGGRAWVEDRPGGGASFRIYLPGS
jgi:two-component system, sensor histidine kinase and response regulator